jgi:CRISPR-associated protein Csb2
MPQFKDRPKLVLDGFVAVDPDTPLVMIWPTLCLPPKQSDLFDTLLAKLTYLGRAESWIEARRLWTPTETNCRPATSALDPETGEVIGEMVTLLAPLTASAYSNLREGFQKNGKVIKSLMTTLPESLVDALSLETAELRRHGWNRPPAAREVSYLRPLNSFKPRRRVRSVETARINVMRFVLFGKPLPPVEETLRLGELMRTAAMSRARDLWGEDKIPSIISGHGLPPGHYHLHAFYLAFDSNGDGCLDRLLVYIPPPGCLEPAEQYALSCVRYLRSRNGMEWRLSLEAAGGADVAPELCGPATRWISVTPYLHPWHLKKRFGIEDQIHRECRLRGLDEPVDCERLSCVTVGRRGQRRTLQFKRIRNPGQAQNQLPDTRGSFWRLRFAEPFAYPLALGTFCHFGLGLFRPDPEGQTGR